MSNSNIHSSDNQRRFSAQEMSLGSVIHVSPAEDWDTPQIISPPITIAIAIFSSGVVALLIWAVTYRLPIYASSKGLLYQSPKLSSVTVKTDGLIDDIYVKVGDSVDHGQQLALLDFTNHQIRESTASIQSELAKENDIVASNLIPGELNQQIESYRKSLNTLNNNLIAQKKVLEKKVKNLENYKSLVAKGYLSEVEYLKYEEDLVSMESSIGKLQSEQNKLYAQRESTRRELKKALNSSKSSLSQALEEKELKANELKSAKDITSPIKGSVVQITKLPGQSVTKGLELFVISPNNSKGLKGTFLVSGSNAGKIKVGDRALISPSSAPSQRYGYIQGYVESISPYPSNPSAIASFIGSENLAKTVFSEEMEKLPLLVVVKPEYKNGKLVWEGSKGPEWPIRSGTSANVKIIYKQRIPISYVLPWVKSITGIGNI